ncbi:hypothetical protein FE257_005802 [Aspergillus nanangensis]|uniref:Uncharacterized protein n=1 Tax=Aspergillus nanangensis TaxID=2582783 RepID=A0AAD4GMS5_ASPNN|nr:hypothetical protein FE257_005802 [Aspergillus nanangensis]
MNAESNSEQRVDYGTLQAAIELQPMGILPASEECQGIVTIPEQRVKLTIHDRNHNACRIQ